MKKIKLLAVAALVAVCAGALSGCYVETRPHYHHYYYR